MIFPVISITSGELIICTGSPLEAGDDDIRQVLGIDVSRLVTESRAQVLENVNGKNFAACKF